MQRCAIYTRKSTEEGLEQDFNSLHAQREACEAYIKSQRHEGWKLVRTKFDDGGFSGGSINRPALQDLLATIERNEVDIIIVYKVDRLTRSLADFAKIVELFDANNVSFVSVTQQFNTTSSMGRLTLNVLLSFAQFEREVTTERIRDKIAASKKKGMWMGGPLPLGYDVENRKLIINEAEAQTVRKLFQMYINLGTVRWVKEDIDRLSIVTKRRTQKNGKQTGGKPFSRGNLYQLLSNPLYIGKIPHKGKTYPGQHQAIIDQKTWDAALDLLSGNATNRTHATNTKGPFLLTGKVFDETGEPLYQHQASKQGKRYFYYISKHLTHGTNDSKDGWRLPAKTLESAVTAPLCELLNDPIQVIDLLNQKHCSPTELTKLEMRATNLFDQIAEGGPQVRRDALNTIINRIDLSTDALAIVLNKLGLAEALGATCSKDTDLITITVPVRLKRRGVEAKMIIEGQGENSPYLNRNLCRLIAQARCWFDQLATGQVSSVREIAKQDSVNENEITRTLPLAFLAPTIVEDILGGRQTEGLTAYRLKRLPQLPLDWAEQTKTLQNLA